ncbi:MAG: hypothetical protein ACLQBK_12075 [Candidatus Sulfotelmatobacter sp.]
MKPTKFKRIVVTKRVPPENLQMVGNLVLVAPELLEASRAIAGSILTFSDRKLRVPDLVVHGTQA